MTSPLRAALLAVLTLAGCATKTSPPPPASPDGERVATAFVDRDAQLLNLAREIAQKALSEPAEARDAALQQQTLLTGIPASQIVELVQRYEAVIAHKEAAIESLKKQLDESAVEQRRAQGRVFTQIGGLLLIGNVLAVVLGGLAALRRYWWISALSVGLFGLGQLVTSPIFLKVFQWGFLGAALLFAGFAFTEYRERRRLRKLETRAEGFTRVVEAVKEAEKEQVDTSRIKQFLSRKMDLAHKAEVRELTGVKE